MDAVTRKPALMDYLTKDELVELCQPSPGLVILHLCGIWLCVLVTLQGLLWMPTWWLGILGFLVVAVLQNALALWTHEASHFNLSRNKRRNDWLADFFIAGPIGLSVAQYRWHHIPHHVHLNDSRHEVNPLAWICLRGRHLFTELLKSMAGYYGVQALARFNGRSLPKTESRAPRSLISLAGFGLFNGLLFLQCLAQGGWYWYFLLWVMPIFSLTLLIGNLRTIVEHQPSSDVCDVGNVPLPPITRVIKANRLERICFAPVGLYYHYEHHLCPAIPFHRLRDLRRMLRSRGFFARHPMIHGPGYLGTVWALSRLPGFGVRVLTPSFQPPQKEKAA